ncbi:hypothetical protein ND748_11800 [Frankia sp. AiPs1]|uniref:hypothetical protein n=1 Tax=Frankia sp. AiPs1 TaxID=573493 RepID=UPI00204490DF|nr:hypothetical protein [Frankia sp. AiPs1]MCM3922339.1 hypothetical protein [Frankia sp. AiPs1]
MVLDRLIADQVAAALAMAGRAIVVAVRTSRTDGANGVPGVGRAVGAGSRTDAARPVVPAWAPDRRPGPRAIAIDYSP